MRKLLRLAFISIFMAIMPVSMAKAESRLISPPIEGYIIGHEAADADQSIREEVPEGETVHNWTSMITTQRFGGVQIQPLQFAQMIEASIAQSCADVTKSDPASIEHMGYEAASFSASCFQSENWDGAETFFMMIVRTPDALLVKQVAFMGEVRDEDVEFAVAVLRSAIVCEETCPQAIE